ncbi:MAG: hypothetical protein MUC50_19745 [Myxococcota bacterium]|jgi:hypothetical protein|nr:hypothetical protein [Myxococcota bacterium]
MSDSNAPAIRHLRQFDIDRLLAGETHGLEAVITHADDCQTCRAKFEEQRQAQRAYIEPRAQAESEKLVALAAQRAKTTARARTLSAIASVAAAAAIAFVCAVFFTGREPLPEYSLSVSHGTRALRDDKEPAPQVPRFSPHSRLRIDLRPANAYKGTVQTRVWAEQEDHLQQARLAVKTSGEGALRLEGVVGEDFSLPPGTHTLWVFIFHRGNYDDEAAIRAAITNGRLAGDDGALLKTEIVIGASNEAPVPQGLRL